jgi:hypothetical protein
MREGKAAPVPFPMRLHNLLDDAEIRGYQHIVAWQPDGRSFKVKDPDAIEKVLAKYFKLTKYRSFLRQLQDYGFSRVSWGSETGLCSHPSIVRGQRQRCKFMYRKQTNSGNSVSTMACNKYLPPLTVSTYTVQPPPQQVQSDLCESMTRTNQPFSAAPATDVSHGAVPSTEIPEALALSLDIGNSCQLYHLGEEQRDAPQDIPRSLEGNDLSFKPFLLEGFPEVTMDDDSTPPPVVEEAAFEGCRFYTL